MSENAVLDAIFETLLEEYKKQVPDDKGVHIETMLSILGTLAGFGCQMGIRQAFIKSGKATEEDLFVVVETNNGEKYYYGEFLNEPIFSTDEGRISVWSLVGGAAQSLSATTLPDISEIAAYYAENVGDEKFFIPQLPANHMPLISPVDSLCFWEPVQTTQILHSVDPIHWGWNCALVAQRLIIQGEDIIDPGLAAKIVMEAAVPMSKYDPEKVKQSFFNDL